MGLPLPGIEAKIGTRLDQHFGDHNNEGVKALKGFSVDSRAPASEVQGPGELYVRGNTMFKEYWGMPHETRAAFTADGYFKTGDTVIFEGDPLYYKFLGRTSVDIIKSGGYAISALEIEICILDHPFVAECAVIGIPDETYGEVVGVVVACKNNASLGLDSLREFCRPRLAPYKLPKSLWEVDKLQRNTMGKVNKRELVKNFPDSCKVASPQ